jgi:hypothetical protein
MSKDLPTGSDQFREIMQSRKCIGSGATGSRGGFYPDLFKVDSPENKADWSLWGYKPTVSILEACYLSLNIAPEVHDVLEREAKGIAIHEMHHKQARDIVELYKKIEKRVKIVVANHPDNGGELPIFRTFRHPSGTLVRLSEFGAWAKSMGWDLPPEFPAGTSTDVHQQDTVTVTALQDIPTAIKAAKKPETVQKMLKTAQAFHAENGRYPEGRELFDMGKEAHGYDDWETFRKTFVRYFSEAG